MKSGKVIRLPVQPALPDGYSPIRFGGLMFSGGLVIGVLLGFVLGYMLGGDR